MEKVWHSLVVLPGIGLQWSRFFSKRKTEFLGRHPQRARQASMEPLFFKAENPMDAWRVPGGFSSFNGAAFFQSGKPEVRQHLRREIDASMEPLFFKAENTPGRLPRSSICVLFLPRRVLMTTVVSDRRDFPDYGGDGPRRSAAIAGRTRHG